MKSLFSFLLCGMFILSFGPLLAQSEIGNGNVQEENRKLSGFTAIEVTDGIDVVLLQAESEKVVVKADENLLDNIETVVSGNTLKISAKGSIRRAKAFDVYVTVKNLERLEASSGSDVATKETVNLDEVVIRMSSGSDLDMSLNARQLTCKLSSGSDANLSGKVEILMAEAHGGSDISAKKLATKKCTLKAHGGSDASINVTGELDIEAHGASDIYYTGNPTVLSKKASGGSDIHGN